MILAMAGGTPEHARLAMAVGTELVRQLGGRRCAVYSGALRVRVRDTGFAGYPDVTVICEELQRDPEDANKIVNPTLVVEVLSPSTEEYDRGEKLAQCEVDWERRTFGAGERAELDALGCVLPVDDIFRNPLG